MMKICADYKFLNYLPVNKIERGDIYETIIIKYEGFWFVYG